MAASTLSFATAGATLIQGFQQFQAIGAEAEAAQQSSDFKTKQIQNDIEREKAAAAIEARNREERLRQNLAAQRAAFGATNVDLNSGTPMRLREASTSSINREQGQADFVSGQNILSLNSEAEQVSIGNQAVQSAFRLKRGSSLLNTSLSTAGHIQIGLDELERERGN